MMELQNEKELISIIVPIYNTQEYLRECIDSILNQTYKNIEIILVNDGSTDDSGQICDLYASCDKRIKVVHQKNKGISAARNEGIKCSQGSFITFVDSDDYIRYDMMERLYKEITENDAEMVICNFICVDSVGKQINKQDSPISNELLTSEQVINKFFEPNDWFYSVLWNKIYKKSLWEGLKFPEGYIHEDEYIIHHLLYRCKKIVSINDELYFYRKNEASVTHVKNARRADRYYALTDRILFMEKKTTKDTMKKICAMFWYEYFDTYFTILNDKENHKYSIQMKKNLCNVLPIMIKSKALTYKETIVIMIFLICPYMYKKIFM